MSVCPVCGKPLEARKVKCFGCAVELHRECAKKTMGKFYCRRCYREGKRRARLERMRQWGGMGKKVPHKLW